MPMPLPPNFERWTPQEIHNAEIAAIDFLNTNIRSIAETFDKRIILLRRVTARMQAADTGFEERMFYLSLVQEIAEGLGESAREFFEVGSRPTVASLVQEAY